MFIKYFFNFTIYWHFLVRSNLFWFNIHKIKIKLQLITFQTYFRWSAARDYRINLTIITYFHLFQRAFEIDRFIICNCSTLFKIGFVHIFRNHFPELTDGILRPEVAIVRCGQRPQHLWGHRSPYPQPEAATVPFAQRAQDSLCHKWLHNIRMFPKPLWCKVFPKCYP